MAPLTTEEVRYAHTLRICGLCGDTSGRAWIPGTIETGEVGPFVCRPCLADAAHEAICRCQHVSVRVICKSQHPFVHHLSRYLGCKAHRSARLCPAFVDDDEVLE